MDAIESIHRSANDALVKEIAPLDKALRPLQRAYFACCYACHDDAKPMSEVAQCAAACAGPVEAVQESFGQAQQAFQQRVSRCHQIAGEAVPSGEAARGPDGKPSAAALAAYVGKLRPCVEEEVRKLDNLLGPIKQGVPKALEAVAAATPAGGPQLGAPAAAKKGWW